VGLNLVVTNYCRAKKYITLIVTVIQWRGDGLGRTGRSRPGWQPGEGTKWGHQASHDFGDGKIAGAQRADNLRYAMRLSLSRPFI